MRFDGDIIITDPCYICKDGDWNKSCYGSHMEVLGIKNYLSRDTIYGDWSCTVFEGDFHTAKDGDELKVLGEFCADAGMMAVFLLDEVLAYNPGFDYHIKRTWTTALIKDFHGDISFEVIHKEGTYTKKDEEFYEGVIKAGDKWEDDSVHIIGKGNINFFSSQTGL